MARGNNKRGQQLSLAELQGVTVRTAKAPNFFGFREDSQPLKLNAKQLANRDTYKDGTGKVGDLPERTPMLRPELFLNSSPKATLKDIITPGDIVSTVNGLDYEPYRVSKVSGKSFVAVDKDYKPTKFTPDKLPDGRIWRFKSGGGRGLPAVFGVSRQGTTTN